jgi:mono/diheme cytochrome c family protein
MNTRHARAITLTIACLALPGTVSAATGSQLFSSAGCSGCHTLAAAGAAGSAGPNLDQLRPSASAVASQVTYGGGGMPSFGSSLGAANISTLATWVSSVAGGSSASTNASASGVAGLSAAEVKKLQRGLARLGYFHHAVTGYFGPVTATAVKAFQKAMGLKSDGVWGPKTAAALARSIG